MISIIELEKSVRPFPLFRDISTANFSRIFQDAQLTVHQKGDVIWRALDPALRFSVVLEGVVEISTFNREGALCVLAIFGPGEICGISAVVKKIPFPATATCGSKQARILKCSLPSLHGGSLLDQENFFDWQRRALLVHEQALLDKIATSSSGTIHERLLELFCRLGRRFPDAKHERDEKGRIALSLTKTQIAKLIGARVETVIRTLRVWEKKNLLRFGKDSIQISTNLFGSTRPCDDPRDGVTQAQPTSQSFQI